MTPIEINVETAKLLGYKSSPAPYKFMGEQGTGENWVLKGWPDKYGLPDFVNSETDAQFAITYILNTCGKFDDYVNNLYKLIFGVDYNPKNPLPTVSLYYLLSAERNIRLRAMLMTAGKWKN